MAASNRLSKSATAPPVITAFWRAALCHFGCHTGRDTKRRSRQHKCHQVHPAWRGVASVCSFTSADRDQFRRIRITVSGCADPTSFSCPVSTFFPGWEGCPDRQFHPCHQAPLPALPRGASSSFVPVRLTSRFSCSPSERRRAISSSFRHGLLHRKTMAPKASITPVVRTRTHQGQPAASAVLTESW